MYESQLEAIRLDMAEDGEKMQPPCTEAAIEALDRRMREILGVPLSGAHAAFLRRADGIDYNGLVIYASERGSLEGYEDRTIDGVVEANLDLRSLEPMRRYLVIAESGTLLWVLDLETSTYRSVDRTTLDPHALHDSFESMLADALARHL